MYIINIAYKTITVHTVTNSECITTSHNGYRQKTSVGVTAISNGRRTLNLPLGVHV